MTKYMKIQKILYYKDYSKCLHEPLIPNISTNHKIPSNFSSCRHVITQPPRFINLPTLSKPHDHRIASHHIKFRKFIKQSPQLTPLHTSTTSLTIFKIQYTHLHTNHFLLLTSFYHNKIPSNFHHKAFNLLLQPTIHHGIISNKHLD